MRAHQRPGRSNAGSVAGLWRALGLTVASALVWGIAHIWAGRRAAGFLLMGLFAALSGALAVLGLGFQEELKRIAVQRTWLNVITIGIVLLAVFWGGVVLRSYLILRPAGLPAAIRVTAGTLVTVLVVMLCTPLVYAANATYVLRDTLGSIFHGDGNGPKINTADPWKDKPRLNVLLLGGDGGADRSGVRPDSMTVASIDTHNGNTVLFSLPRSLQKFPMPARLRTRWPAGYTGYPGDQGLLNELYQAAETHPELEPGQPKGQRGPHLTEEVIGNLLGLKIDYYILVNLDGFKDIVDAMGGVVVNVTKRLPIGGDDDPHHLRPATGYLEPGRQRLNGEKALWFGRSRHADDDFHRMDRQKCLLKDIAEQANPQKILTRFEKLAEAAKGTVDTNIPAELLPALVTLSGSIKKGSSLHSIPFNPYKLTGFHVYEPEIQVMRQVTRAGIADSEKPPTPKPTTTGGKKKTASGTGGSSAGGSTSLKDICG
ncbi:LCP family protein [Actinoallomurus acaciae]|uniref:LCP family protein n=1 Tax=Actinoallomurus acaciae TaxID=502577 RepID=A0ABV5YCV6_9ACTN